MIPHLANDESVRGAVPGITILPQFSRNCSSIPCAGNYPICEGFLGSSLAKSLTKRFNNKVLTCTTRSRQLRNLVKDASRAVQAKQSCNSKHAFNSGTVADRFMLVNNCFSLTF